MGWHQRTVPWSQSVREPGRLQYLCVDSQNSRAVSRALYLSRPACETLQCKMTSWPGLHAVGDCPLQWAVLEAVSGDVPGSEVLEGWVTLA